MKFKVIWYDIFYDLARYIYKRLRRSQVLNGLKHGWEMAKKFDSN